LILYQISKGKNENDKAKVKKISHEMSRPANDFAGSGWWTQDWGTKSSF
jgi:hypothetical protein